MVWFLQSGKKYYIGRKKLDKHNCYGHVCFAVLAELIVDGVAPLKMHNQRKRWWVPTDPANRNGNEGPNFEGWKMQDQKMLDQSHFLSEV